MKNKVCMRVALVIATFVAMIYLLSSAGFYLVKTDPPEKADAIVIFSGDRGSRVEKAAELYKKGYASVVVISGGEVYHEVVMARLMEKHAEDLGIPHEAILIEENADSTWENATCTIPILKKIEANKVLLVTSEYHTRRVAYVLKRTYGPSGINFGVVGAKDSSFFPEAWWSTNKSAMNTVKEYIKLVGYVFGRRN